LFKTEDVFEAFETAFFAATDDVFWDDEDGR
jgi:hypothetical protein